MAWPTKTDFVDGDVLTAAQVNNIGTNLNVFNPTSATNGQVLTADGSGSAAYQTLSAGGWTLINSGTLSGASITSSTFSGYRQLHIDIAGATSSAAANLSVRLNGVSTAVYGRWGIASTGTTTVYIDQSASDSQWTTNTLALSAAHSQRIDIYNTNTATSLKIMTVDTVRDTSTINQTQNYAHGWANIAAAITSVTIFISGATWTAGSYYIYGLK